MFLRGSGRAFSTASIGRRVLCSLNDLQKLQGKGLKFPLHPPEPNEAPENKTISRRRRDLLATGFLDFDDSDFFCEGFIHCKAHAAFFDPDTGICLQGPISSRKALRGLDELRVEIDGDDVVLLDKQAKARFTSMPAYDSQEPETYKREKQRELAEALSKRSNMSEVEQIQQNLHEKTMARLKQYEQIDNLTLKPKK
eukprot:jgi/Phyca11/9495/fgenesh1_pm.PHYCAscaffold_38_\